MVMLIQAPALQNRQWWSVELMSRWLHFLSSWSCEYAYTGRFLCPHVLCPNEIQCRKVYNRLVLGSPRCFFFGFEGNFGRVTLADVFSKRVHFTVRVFCWCIYLLRGGMVDEEWWSNNTLVAVCLVLSVAMSCSWSDSRSHDFCLA